MLLHLEELATEAEIESFQMTNVTLLHRGEFLVLNVPGVLDGKPSLCVGKLSDSTASSTLQINVILKYFATLFEMSVCLVR